MTYGMLEYEIDGHNEHYIRIVGCNKLISGAISIPEFIEEMQVREIAANAFLECCYLTSIELPNSIRHIGIKAFEGCKALKRIQLPPEIIRIERRTFYQCESLTSVIFPKELEEIKGAAFYGCKQLRTIELPERLETIGSCAFAYCSSLTSVKVSYLLTTVEQDAFRECPNLYKDENGIIYESENRMILVKAPKDIEHLTIPESVNFIHSEAFSHCNQLTAIKFPPVLCGIGFGAFLECTALTSVSIQRFIGKINDGAFAGCTNLTSIKWENPEKKAYNYLDPIEITTSAFAYCSSLVSISIPLNAHYILKAFWDCPNLKCLIFYGPPPFAIGCAWKNPTCYYNKAYAKEWEEAIAKGRWKNETLVMLDLDALSTYGKAIEGFLKDASEESSSWKDAIYPLASFFAGIVLSAYLKGTTEPSYRDYLILLAECAKQYDEECWKYLKIISHSLWHTANLMNPSQVPQISDVVNQIYGVMHEVDVLAFPPYPTTPGNRAEYRALGEKLSEIIVDAVIKSFKGMESDCGPDYNLNAWEAFCVQCQGEQAFSWDAYVDTIKQIIHNELKKYQPHEIKALKVYHWIDEEDEDYDEDSLEKELFESIWSVGCDYTNPAIARVLYNLDEGEAQYYYGDDEDEDSYEDEDDEETDEAFESDDNDEEDEESESLTQEVAMPSPTFNLKVSSEFEAAADELANVLDEIAKQKSQEHD